MNSLNLIKYILLYPLPLYILYCIGLAGVFRKFGVPGWKAAVPLYNVVIVNQILQWPRAFAMLHLVPGINWVFWLVQRLALTFKLGQTSFLYYAATVFFGPLFLIYQGWGQNSRPLNEPISYPIWWKIVTPIYSILLLAGLFFTQAINISGLRGNNNFPLLKDGQVILINQLAYGYSPPPSIIRLPFPGKKIPLIGTDSYLPPYFLPQTRIFPSNPERWDLVAFHYPMDDIYPDIPGAPHTVIYRKPTYLSQMVGLPGETIQITAAKVSINGKEIKSPPEISFSYFVKDPQGQINWSLLMDLDLHSPLYGQPLAYRTNGGWQIPLSDLSYEKINALPGVKIVPQIFNPQEEGIESYIENQKQLLFNQNLGKAAIFPKDPDLFPYSPDYFGPITIPKTGNITELSPKTLPLIRRVIEVYEGHTVRLQDGKIFIDDQQADTYKFEQDYFFVMGVNRHESFDSRYFGFVPASHLIGKVIY